MNNAIREFYEIEGAANILDITVDDLWHLIEVDRIDASFRQVIADATFDMNGKIPIYDLVACHTFLIPKSVARVIAVKGRCVTKNALIYLSEPEENIFLDMNEGECIGFCYTHEFELDKEVELHKGDVVITQTSIENYITSYSKLHGNENDAVEMKSKPFNNKERETLLVIIAALAKEAGLDITKISKTGDLIANMTQLIGTPIGATTIETHLKKINQALVNRTK